MRTTFIFLSGLILLGAAAPELQVSSVFSGDAIVPGGKVDMAVRVTVPDGWHVNANKPLDEFSVPTALTLTLPSGATVAETVYPEAKTATLEFSTDPLALYDGTFTIGVRLVAEAGITPGDYPVEGSLRYQACNSTTCAPPKNKEFDATLKVLPAGQAVTPANAEAFKDIGFTGGTAADEVAVVSEASKGTSGDASSLIALLDRFEIVGSAIGYKNVEQFRAFLANPAANSSDPAEGVGAAPGTASPFAGKSLWMVVLLTLLGGLALNLTPCVLPLIPVNIAIIGAGANAGSKGRGFTLGLAYGAGMTGVYGVLGVIAAVTTSTFGAINSSPWFNMAIAVVFVVLGLAMFDLLLIDFTRFQTKLGVRKNEGGNLGVALFMGAVSALLAGACVAPVVIAVILFARNLYAEGSALGLVLPFVLGAGMALPWPFAGAGMTFMPKPGMWMVRVKQAFGVFIFLFAAYYAHLAWTQFRPAPAEVSEVTGPWDKSLEAGLRRGLDQNRPVIVDFWATWCKNCLAMDKSTFKDSSVLKDLEAYVPVKYQAEHPEESPHREVMDRLGVIGLPTVVVLKPKGA